MRPAMVPTAVVWSQAQSALQETLERALVAMQELGTSSAVARAVVLGFIQTQAASG
jgi:hypothetical protein